MGLFARAFTRQNFVAIAVGVLVAGTPLIAFDFWLSSVVDRQGQEESMASAKRTIALAESRVGEVVTTLDSLAAQGVDSCAPANIAVMRLATFRTAPIKEIAIVESGGKILCTDLNQSSGGREILSSAVWARAAGYSLDTVRLADGQHMVRLRRATGANEIAALVPAALFLPQISTQGEAFSAYARIETPAGALIGETGGRPIGRDGDVFVATLRSNKLGSQVVVMTPLSHTLADYADMKWLGLFVTGLVALMLAGISMLIPKYPSNNPVAELERALAAGELVPYYQPIVDIISGQLRGAEVLVRWRKPDGSVVLPGAFIPLAESSGLIRAMTYDLMRRVSAEAGEAIGRRPALKISFNFAGMLFGSDMIVKDVRNIFAKSPIKLSQVVLEVTERDPIENFTATRQTIAALQGLGVRIAIDDVGTGHSGLSYMLKLGVDIIKIDKMFVDAIGTDRNSTTIVETLVDLAHNMRMDVVAEGVENFEQVMHLRELGIRSAQGYVFAPPLPGKAFLQLVEAMDNLGVDAAERTTPVAAGSVKAA